MEKRIIWKVTGIITFIISILFVISGLDKLWAADAYRNSYVGGDAYNLIINASRATAYFVLASFFVLLAIGCGVFYFLGNKELIDKKVASKDEEQKAEDCLKQEEKEDDSWVCAKCGATNKRENIFCNKCGEKNEIL